MPVDTGTNLVAKEHNGLTESLAEFTHAPGFDS